MLSQLTAEIGPAWAWILAGLLLMGTELALPGVFLVWLGLAALLTGLLAALVTLPWQAQLLVFAGLAVVSVALASRLTKRPISGLNRADRGLIGREGMLTTDIVGGTGTICFDDTLWRITGPDLPAGSRVRVTGMTGTMLTVAAV
ncbi:membrane protein implicated in regulation of membrane protease activity [Methylobacterium sp. BE186]|uniref:NfeD family protein n=1 Tax=Methylobacterium sp. BE186 TaxID=2817715 RepID=UPI00285F52D7|nr:NfeD family protein [Methylobacterium sp. BE186]MDR7035451.1 membrane protein implicated in regulation of membrane protease activity [Methylobacterium sp. BE186]